MTFKTQSLEDFYKSRINSSESFSQTNHFNAFSIQDRIRCGVGYPTYIRRDFYKIMLFQGATTFHFGDQSIPVSNNTLLFFNPRVPYTYEPIAADAAGYFCVFKDDFFKENLRLQLDEIPLFLPGAKPVFHLKKSELKEVDQLFKKMMANLNSDYAYKYELIRSYVSELIYYAMKLEPLTYTRQEINASTRITSVFLELLDRQFPVELGSDRILLRTPKDFAEQLAIHVNSLNRAVKKETGKTTTDYIFERLAGEAKAMLKYTDLNIAEISFALGFEDQAHFNHFFKKHASMSPTSFRSV